MIDDQQRKPYQQNEGDSDSKSAMSSNNKPQEDTMNQDQAKGKFEQFKGKLKETWGRLTDDEIALYNGQREQFLGRVQEKYGLMQDEADQRLKKIEEDSGRKAA